MRLTCSVCKHGFYEGDKISYRGISVYHEVAKPQGEQFYYAVEKPRAVLDIQHWICEPERSDHGR